MMHETIEREPYGNAGVLAPSGNGAAAPMPGELLIGVVVVVVVIIVVVAVVITIVITVVIVIIIDVAAKVLATAPTSAAKTTRC